MSIIFQVGLGGARSHGRSWDRDAQDLLSSMAAKFKKNGDIAGVHLCAIIDTEMAKAASGESDCECVGRFYLALAMSRMMAGADRQLAHIMLPQIQEMMAEGMRQAQFDRLKREVGIDT